MMHDGIVHINISHWIRCSFYCLQWFCLWYSRICAKKGR